MEHHNQTILLTGGRGVGKTTVCQAVAELVRRRGYRPGGVITPALYACPEHGRRDSHGAKIGFEAVDVGSGEHWPLARTDQELGGPGVGPYSLDPAALARALKVLRKAAIPETSTTVPCDLFMLDEIGPLELEQGEGFAPILDLLPLEGPTYTLIVVRPALLDQLRLHLRDTECTVFNVTEGNRDEMPLWIVEELWRYG
ncbi:MAG: nucleoside-triphosphatase [Anaerolineae bacterium]